MSDKILVRLVALGAAAALSLTACANGANDAGSGSGGAASRTGQSASAQGVAR